MHAKLLVTLLAGVLIGLGASFLVNRVEAQAQPMGPRPSFFEFKVVTFPYDERKASDLLNTLDSDHWQYVGPIHGGANNGPSFIAFKRPKGAK